MNPASTQLASPHRAPFGAPLIARSRTRYVVMKQALLAKGLAVAAVLLGAVLAFTDHAPTSADAQLAGQAGTWAEQIESEADHITPNDLATRLLARGADTLVVDVRPAEEFAVWHLPGAQHLPIPELIDTKGERLLAESKGKLVVLVSNGMVHPGQAWVALVSQGASNVRVLEGGLTAFKRQVLTPPSLRGPISARRSAAEMPRFRAARAYFLGAGSRVATATAVAGAHVAP